VRETPPNALSEYQFAKERVVFVERGAQALAVPFSALKRARDIHVTLAGEPLEVAWLPGVRSSYPAVDDPRGHVVGSALVRLVRTGQPVPADTPFWFAAATCRPNVIVWHG
jgi:hypothetical protein